MFMLAYLGLATASIDSFLKDKGLHSQMKCANTAPSSPFRSHELSPPDTPTRAELKADFTANSKMDQD